MHNETSFRCALSSAGYDDIVCELSWGSPAQLCDELIRTLERCGRSPNAFLMQLQQSHGYTAKQIENALEAWEEHEATRRAHAAAPVVCEEVGEESVTETSTDGRATAIVHRGLTALPLVCALALGGALGYLVGSVAETDQFDLYPQRLRTLYFDDTYDPQPTCRDVITEADAYVDLVRNRQDELRGQIVQFREVETIVIFGSEGRVFKAAISEGHIDGSHRYILGVGGNDVNESADERQVRLSSLLYKKVADQWVLQTDCAWEPDEVVMRDGVTVAFRLLDTNACVHGEGEYRSVEVGFYDHVIRDGEVEPWVLQNLNVTDTITYSVIVNPETNVEVPKRLYLYDAGAYRELVTPPSALYGTNNTLLKFTELKSAILGDLERSLTERDLRQFRDEYAPLAERAAIDLRSGKKRKYLTVTLTDDNTRILQRARSTAFGRLNFLVFARSNPPRRCSWPWNRAV